MKINYPACAIMLAFMFFVTSCSNQKADTEAQKLVDRQAELVREGQEEIEDFMDEMSSIKDSMAVTQKRLASGRQQIAGEMKSLEKEKVELEMTKEREKLNLLQSKRDSLSRELTSNIAMERRIFDQIERMELLEDSLLNTSTVLSRVIEGSESQYENDIEDVDRQLGNIERQRTSARRSIDLNEQKIEVAKQKVKLLQDEQAILQEEKTYQLRIGAADENVNAIEEELSQLADQIATSKQKIENASALILASRNKISELKVVEQGLQDQINLNNETQGAVSQYIESEEERTREKVTEIREKTDELVSDKADISESKQLLEQKLDKIDEQITQLENNRLPKLQNRIEGIEQQDTEVGTSPLKVESELDSLDSALLATSEDFEKESESLSNEKILMSKQAEELQKDRWKKIKIAVITIAALVLIIGLLLYLLGRRKKKNTSK